MDNDEIRFRGIYFNWFERTVKIEHMVGTRAKGGYEQVTKISFEAFQQLIDTTILREYLSPKPKPVNK